MKLFWIMVFCLFSSVHGKSQNLIHNPDFERHKEFPPGLSPFKWGTIEYLRDWTYTGWEVIDYCHLSLENRTDKIFKRTSCCGNTINPHSGSGMVKMAYSESCPFTPSTGCTDYLTAVLSSPLVVGDIYEVSMWVYFPGNWAEDSTIYSSIGMYLTLYPVKVGSHEMSNAEFYFGDTIIPNKWIQIKHYVRALCPLKHLTIGAFRNDKFPTLHRAIDNMAVYFIDDVKVIEVPEENLPKNILPTPFCNYFERIKKAEEIVNVDEINIFFEPDEVFPDANDLAKIDSFYLSKEGNQNREFIITGHTDDEGNDNLRLSLERAIAAKEYLKLKYNIEDHRLISFGMGIDTLGNNSTSKDKQLNRRVTIQNSNISSLQALYRKGLDHVSSKVIPEAAKTFKAWIELAPRDKKIQILHDPRLQALKTESVWPYLVAEVRKHYRYYSKPINSFFLDSLFFTDQRYRTYTPTQLSGIIPGIDSSGWSRQERNYGWKEICFFDSLNLAALQSYILKHGYPKISDVGRRPAKAATHIFIHSNDTTSMIKYLSVIEKYCLEGEAEWESYAILFDKIQTFRGLPQHYGTQYSINEENQVTGLYPVDDMEKVNIRRKRIGLHQTYQH